MKHVTIYTDGACRGNPGIGGWGALLQYEDQKHEIHGGEHDTTNNRMELTAAIEALKCLNQPCQIDLYTDSKYVMQGITEWIIGWKQRNWRTASKQPVKNVELWQQLDKYNDKHKIDWRWVKGHSGDPGNERADALANLGIDELGAKV